MIQYSPFTGSQCHKSAESHRSHLFVFFFSPVSHKGTYSTSLSPLALSGLRPLAARRTIPARFLLILTGQPPRVQTLGYPWHCGAPHSPRMISTCWSSSGLPRSAGYASRTPLRSHAGGAGYWAVKRTWGAEGYGRHRVAVKRPSRPSPLGTRAARLGSERLGRGGVRSRV